MKTAILFLIFALMIVSTVDTALGALRIKPVEVTSGSVDASVTESQPATSQAGELRTQEMTNGLSPSPNAQPIPAAGEQIKWWVVGAGGGTSASTNYKLGSTVGQTAAGMAQSASYKVNQGFWQNFGPASCCTGTTGNVNMTGIVDGGDLALLVAYLTNAPGSKPTLPCPEEANVNATGIVDGGDLALLVAYLTNAPGSKPTLPNCP